jgi:hypothetical protein
VFIIKLDYLFENALAIFTMIALIIFIGICFIPFHVFYLRARKDLLLVLWHILISPFGIVRFKHFFLADIITSFVNPLKDVGTISCFFFRGYWENSDLPSTSNCPSLQDY